MPTVTVDKPSARTGWCNVRDNKLLVESFLLQLRLLMKQPEVLIAQRGTVYHCFVHSELLVVEITCEAPHM